VVVAVERDGAVFGELALFDDSPRSATLTAVDETQVVMLARDDFLRVLERSPRATREILRLVARTVRRASGRIEDLVFLDMPGRVAGIGEPGPRRPRRAAGDRGQGARAAAQTGPLLRAS